MGIPTQRAMAPMRQNFKIQKFKGINKSVTPSQIEDGQSPDMLNFLLDNELALDKRPGYSTVFEKLLGADTWADGEWADATWAKGLVSDIVYNMFRYTKTDGNIEILVFHGGDIYKWVGSTITLIYTGIEKLRVVGFQVNDIFYFWDTVSFLSYNGTSFADVTGVNAYIPTITIGRSPSGGGTANEQLNLIGTGFKDSFSADGSSTLYTLSYTNLDSTAVSVNYNAVNYTENIHFSVNRINGTVDFTGGTSPLGTPASGTNNVIITAYKTPTDYTSRKEKIIKCTISEFYGGSNDTRILASGHPTLINIIYRSYLTSAGYADPTYWPENDYSLVGANNEAIINFAKQYNTLFVGKEYTSYNMDFDLSTGESLYPTKPINDNVGILAKYSLQLIDNAPTFLSKKGVFQLVAGQVRDERNMKHISMNIDSDLLAEPNLENAISYDFDRKYYLVLPSGNTYVYDYNVNEWLKWNNIQAYCFIDVDNYLYFGYNAGGKIFKMKKLEEIGAYYDDGVAISSYWKSKVFNMNRGEFQKLIDRLIITLKPYSSSYAKIYYSSDNKISNQVKEIDLIYFDFNTLDFSDFTFESYTLPQAKNANINENSTVYFQIEVENNEAGKTLGIVEISILHAIQKYVI